MAVVTIKLWTLQPWNFLLEYSKLKCYLKKPAVTYLSTWLRTTTFTFGNGMLMIVFFIFNPAAVSCTSISKKQELDKAVAEVGDWEALCGHLGTPQTVLK